MDWKLNLKIYMNYYQVSTSSKMDIIAITETSQNDVNFILKTDIEGYVNCSTPNLSKGGTALFIIDKFDSFERMDLKIQNDNFGNNMG